MYSCNETEKKRNKIYLVTPNILVKQNMTNHMILFRHQIPDYQNQIEIQFRDVSISIQYYLSMILLYNGIKTPIFKQLVFKDESITLQRLENSEIKFNSIQKSDKKWDEVA